MLFWYLIFLSPRTPFAKPHRTNELRALGPQKKPFLKIVRKPNGSATCTGSFSFKDLSDSAFFQGSGAVKKPHLPGQGVDAVRRPHLSDWRLFISVEFSKDIVYN